MKNSTHILRRHYLRLLTRFARMMALGGLAVSVLAPANLFAAGQLTTRSLTLTSSAASANTTYTYSFKPGTTNVIGSIKFELCTSPLEAVGCSTPAGASNAGAGGIGFSGQIAGFSISNGSNNPSPVAKTVWIEKGTPQSLTAGTVSGVSFTGIVNPSTTNQTFYARITTYAETAHSTEIDFGAVAVSTANTVQVNANVQEQLAFCVYTNANCGAGGNSVNIGMNPGAENVLTTSQMYGGVSKMDASTNAATGYVIQYVTTSSGGAGGSQCVGGFSSTADCIADAGGSAVSPPASGTGMFGINLKTNTVTLTPAGAIGANPSGGVGAAVAPYSTADQVAFQAGATPRTVANTGSAPSLNTTYTVTYAAQAGTTTKPGAYSTTFTYIATGTF